MKYLLTIALFSLFIEMSNAQTTELVKRTKPMYENGDVLIKSTDKLPQKANAPYQDEIFGVFYSNTEQPNYASFIEKGVALVKFNPSNGVVKRGDYLTSSDIPGTAMKATKTGMTIGVALEDFKDGESFIKVLVQPLWIRID